MDREPNAKEMKALFSELPDYSPSRGFDAKVLRAIGAAPRPAAEKLLSGWTAHAAVALTAAGLAAGLACVFALLSFYGADLLKLVLHPENLLSALKLCALKLWRASAYLPAALDFAAHALGRVSLEAFGTIAAASALSLLMFFCIPQKTTRRVI